MVCLCGDVMPFRSSYAEAIAASSRLNSNQALNQTIVELQGQIQSIRAVSCLQITVCMREIHATTQRREQERSENEMSIALTNAQGESQILEVTVNGGQVQSAMVRS
jgi:hypothetical protein